MIRVANLNARIEDFTITTGFKPGNGTVPKQDLVGVILAALGTDRIRFTGDLEFTEVLTTELRAFRSKVTPARNESYASWREKDHDDLVLALAIWYGEMRGVSWQPITYPKDAEPLIPRKYGKLRGPERWGR